MTRMGPTARGCHANIALWIFLNYVKWHISVVAKHVILSLETESGHSDIRCDDIYRCFSVVFSDVFIAKHSSVNMLIKVIETCLVCPHRMLVVFVVFVCDVWLQLW